MPQNKLKQKVEALTRVVQQLIKEIQNNASLAQGTLTAFRFHVGDKEWEKIIEELKQRELKAQDEQKEKKLEI